MATKTAALSDDDKMQQLTENSRDASNFLKALANENRLVLLCLLSKGEYSVSQLEDMLGIRQPTLSQQLARLREEELVTTRRDGKTIYYTLSSTVARDIIEVMYKHFCEPDQ